MAKKPSPKARKKPVTTVNWTVVAQCTNGNLDQVWTFETEQEARLHADWAHNSPGFMNVELQGPGFSGTRHWATEGDKRIGSWLAAALEDRKVSPCMKYDINYWMDSKGWPDEEEKAA